MTEKVFLYAELDLPPIPTQLLKDAGEPRIVQVNPDISYGANHVKDGVTLTGAEFKRGVFDYAPLLLWLRENNIPGAEVFSKVHLQFQTGGTHTIHSDVARIYALNYVVEPGGDNVITSWYQQKNNPVHVSKQTFNNSNPPTYKNTVLLGSAHFKKDRWYLIAVNILHDVGVIPGTRKVISFNFTDESIIDLINSKQLIKQQND